MNHEEERLEWPAAPLPDGMEGDAVVKEGFLGKMNRSRLSKVAKASNERWFQLLARGELVYWRSQEEVGGEDPPAGSIGVTDIYGFSQPDATTLSLVTSSRVYTLLARSPEDADEWASALLSLMELHFETCPPWLVGPASGSKHHPVELKDERTLVLLEDLVVLTKHTKKRFRRIERYKGHLSFALSRLLPPRSVRVLDLDDLLNRTAHHCGGPADQADQAVGEDEDDDDDEEGGLHLLDVFTVTERYVPIDPRMMAPPEEDLALGEPGYGFGLRVGFGSREDLVAAKTELTFALSVLGLLAQPSLEHVDLRTAGADTDADADAGADQGGSYAEAMGYTCVIQ